MDKIQIYACGFQGDEFFSSIINDERVKATSISFGEFFKLDSSNEKTVFFIDCTKF